ncbi:MAG: 5'/3'-nucleotidase SurE [Planctomycetes bacterium]|nr:5'/3'-nucleotidase SurE [Planctomycetota bacterium]
MKTAPQHFLSSLILGALALALGVSYVSLQPGATSAQPVSASGTAGPTPRILIANDDGIDHEGLRELVRAMSKVGSVTVAAPPENRSGASHSSSMFQGPMALKQHQIEGAVEAWSVDGTPSDCVAFGLQHLGAEEPFHLVVSGINGGSNVGLVAHYSGTVGAAMEGALRGVPSFAVSMQRGNSKSQYKLAAAFAADFAQKMLEQGQDATVVYSINVPHWDPAKIKGVVIAPMDGIYLQNPSFTILDTDSGQQAKANIRFGSDYPVGCDTHAYYEDNIVVAPLLVNHTAHAKIAELQTWSLQTPTPKSTSNSNTQK